MTKEQIKTAIKYLEEAGYKAEYDEIFGWQISDPHKRWVYVDGVEDALRLCTVATSWEHMEDIMKVAQQTQEATALLRKLSRIKK